MSNAVFDENRVPTVLLTSSADGVTPVQLTANPTTHAVTVDDDTTGSDLSGDVASGDENYVPVFMAVSSADGVTPVAVYGDPITGALLIDST